MNVTRDVINDLWPLYESGEASDDTRQLVEAFLDGDQEFSQLLRRLGSDTIQSEALPPLHPDQEVQTLRKTKRLLRLRDALFFIAVFLTFTPLTVYNTSWGSGWVIRDHPILAAGLAATAAVAWCCYFLLRRRLSATGL